MIDIDELSKKIIYYRAINKMTVTDLADKMNISPSTLRKITQKNNSVKETTLVYVWNFLETLESED